MPLIWQLPDEEKVERVESMEGGETVGGDGAETTKENGGQRVGLASFMKGPTAITQMK